MKFEFQRHRIDKFSKEKMLAELEQAAKHFNYIEFSNRDFASVANMSSTVIENGFGSWRKALSALKEHLATKGLTLSPRTGPYNRIYSDVDMFNEMERVWKNRGHRPSRSEWESLKHKISYATYEHRFGGWQNACLKFIEYKMGDSVGSEETNNVQLPDNPIRPQVPGVGDTRTISSGIRVKVWSRDHFRCIFCGRSPATDFGIKLHVDHILPFSKGGKTIVENLQTLCQECNLGKGNK